MNNPIIDALATLMIMTMLMVAGYLWLVHESESVLQHKQHPEQKHEKSVMEKYAPKTFEALSKRTE